LSKKKNDQVQLPVILRIFEEHQNPLDMHTSIMCINILQNIKAVAPKLYEEIAGQTMYLYPDSLSQGHKKSNLKPKFEIQFLTCVECSRS
jgi:hypothetical protein